MEILQSFLSHVPSGAEFVAALPIIFSVILIDGLLSVDNGLIIAARCQHLPDKQRQLAVNIGMGAALVLRLASLFFVSFLLANPWIKLAGGAYLVYMMCSHMGEAGEKTHGPAVGASFASTVSSVVVADFVFSIDNVIAAASLSPKLWVVWTGVIASIFIMIFAVSVFARLLKRYPVLEAIAYVLVGFIGLQLFAEYFFHLELHELQKFGCIIAIVVVGMLYGQVAAVRAVLGVPFRWLGRVMADSARLTDTLLAPLTVTVRVVFGFFTGLFSRS